MNNASIEVSVAWKAIIGQKQIDWTGFENTDQAVQFLHERHNITASGTQREAFRQAFQAYHDAVERHIASSIKDNLRIAEGLALSLAYNGKTVINTTERYGDKLSDLIWGYVDGLQRKYITDRIEGRVSLCESLNWDIDRSNRQFLTDIDIMKGLLG